MIEWSDWYKQIICSDLEEISVFITAYEKAISEHSSTLIHQSFAGHSLVAELVLVLERNTIGKIGEVAFHSDL